ncbi:MAG: hypothetical protein VKK80_13695, partial [Prochlorothrix sp.]|nr:hypothetical protein [Prochlorothrix sp.]
VTRDGAGAMGVFLLFRARAKQRARGRSPSLAQVLPQLLLDRASTPKVSTKKLTPGTAWDRQWAIGLATTDMSQASVKEQGVFHFCQGTD